MADSIGGIGFTGKKNKQPESLQQWWHSSPDNVGRDLTLYCQALELAQRPQRFRNYAYHMVTNGVAPISYGLAMPGGGISGADFAYGGELYNAEFTPPCENLCHIAISTFENKIYCQRPFGEFLAPDDGNTELRIACKEATAWVDQVFDQYKVWSLVQQFAKDSGIVGTGWIFGTALPADRKICLERLDDDLVLLDPTAGENPRSWQIRWFRNRADLIRQYAVGKKEDAENIRTKLESVPGCRLGFFPLPVGYADTIAVCAGYYCARGSDKGRCVIAIDNLVLEDSEYLDEKPPLAKRICERISGSVRGKGFVQTILPIQRELDRTTDNIAEQERVMAWGRAQSPVGNNISVDDLSGNNMIEYTIKPVEFDRGIAPPDQLYQKCKDLRQAGLFSVGITEQQAQGAASQGVTAGYAMMTEMQISDIRHRSDSLNHEAGVEEVLDLIIRLGKKANPDVNYQGRKVDFSKIEKAVKKGKVRSFPLSGLPQSIPGRQQEIDNQYRAGQINKAQYQKLKGYPVTANSNDEQTAPLDLIDDQLDTIVETGEFQVVIPFQDLASAKDKAVRRFQREKVRKLDRKKLQMLAMYIAQVDERLQEQPPPPSAAPAAAPMVPTQAPQG